MIFVFVANMKGTDAPVNGQVSNDTSSEEQGLAETQVGEVRRVWYRSVPFQIAVASGVSFTAPGMWDALGGLGAGGAAEPVSDKYPTSELMSHQECGILRTQF